MSTDLLITGNRNDPFDIAQGVIADGPERVAQHLLYVLMTNAGDIASRPLLGTQLVRRMTNANVLDEPELEWIITGELTDAVSQVRAEDEIEDRADDESIEDAELVSLVARQDRIAAVIRVTTVSGDARRVRTDVANL